MNNDDNEDKEVTERLQCKVSEKNYDLLKSFDYIIKKTGTEMDEPEYYSPSDLTGIKLSFTKMFPKGVDIQLFNMLRVYYPPVEEWIDYDIFKRLDLSNGIRNKHYVSRITVEDSGRVSELKEKYFYDAYSDTLLIACVLLAIDQDKDFISLKPRYEKDIKNLKKHLEILKESYNQNIDDILTGILDGRCGTYHIHIFVDFIYNFVVGDEEDKKDNIKIHRKKLLEILQYLVEIQSKIIPEERKKQVNAIVNVLLEES